jgi:hypothetical protein
MSESVSPGDLLGYAAVAVGVYAFAQVAVGLELGIVAAVLVLHHAHPLPVALALVLPWGPPLVVLHVGLAIFVGRCVPRLKPHRLFHTRGRRNHHQSGWGAGNRGSAAVHEDERSEQSRNEPAPSGVRRESRARG